MSKSLIYGHIFAFVLLSLDKLLLYLVNNQINVCFSTIYYRKYYLCERDIVGFHVSLSLQEVVSSDGVLIFVCRVRESCLSIDGDQSDPE